MRLLVTAFSLCPGQGSEPGVGWHSVCALAEEHEVHVLVDVNWEPKVRAVFDQAAHPRIHLHFIGLPFVSDFVERRWNNGLSWLIYYYLWQLSAWWHGRRLHRELGFDGAQHLTFVKYSVPSGLALLPMPFVFGPVGGGEAAPSCFYREFGWRTRLAEAARVGLQRLALVDPFLRLCVKRSSLAQGTTGESARELTKLGAERVRVLPAVALSEEEMGQIEAACLQRRGSVADVCHSLPSPQPSPEDHSAREQIQGGRGGLHGDAHGAGRVQSPSPIGDVAMTRDSPWERAGVRVDAEKRGLTLLYVGRLIPWKGVHLGLRALAAAEDKTLRYRIIGDGPARPFLEAEAKRLGIAERVEFSGALSRNEVLQAYAAADGFLYPSLHDSGGNAVIEAMCAALPVICLRYGGPDLIVSEDSGWKVDAATPEEAVMGLTQAINEFAADSNSRLARARAAKARCHEAFTWRGRGEELRSIWRTAK